jgi:hypothetical protein
MHFTSVDRRDSGVVGAVVSSPPTLPTLLLKYCMQERLTLAPTATGIPSKAHVEWMRNWVDWIATIPYCREKLGRGGHKRFALTILSVEFRTCYIKLGF